MGSQTVEVQWPWVLHFDPRRLGPRRIGLSGAEPAVGTAKLVSHDLPLLLTRLQLCDRTQWLGRFLELRLGPAGTTRVLDRLRGVPLTVAEL